MSRYPSVAATLILQLTCGGDLPPHAPANAPVARTDSAGVELVVYRTSSPPNSPGWHMGERPSLAIGDVTGSDEYQLSRIRGVVRLGDGRLAVLNGHGPELLLLTRRGDLVRRIGAHGPGPGEFYSPQHLQRDGAGRLVVWDENYGPRTTFDTSGALLAVHGIDRWELDKALEGIGTSEWLTPLPNGAFVAHVRPVGPRDPPPLDRVYRRPLAFVVVDSAYSPHLLAWYEGVSALQIRGPRGMIQPAMPMFPQMSDVAGGGHPLTIFATDGVNPDVDVYDADGRLERIIRLDLPPLPIPRAAMDSAKRNFLSRIPDDSTRSRVRNAIQAIPDQVEYPATHRLLVDGLGCVWVQRPGAGWNVFGADGSWLAKFQVPLSRIWDIGDDYVLGVSVDSLGVEYVREYPLSRSPQAEPCR